MAVAAVALAGCGGGSTAAPKQSGGSTTGASGNSITIKGFAFSPTPLTVTPGESISVTNKDSAVHTITSDDGTSFDSKNLAQGKTYTFKAPAKAGTYTYICNIHQYMKGSLVVK